MADCIWFCLYKICLLKLLILLGFLLLELLHLIKLLRLRNLLHTIILSKLILDSFHHLLLLFSLLFLRYLLLYMLTLLLWCSYSRYCFCLSSNLLRNFVLVLLMGRLLHLARLYFRLFLYLVRLHFSLLLYLWPENLWLLLCHRLMMP